MTAHRKPKMLLAAAAAGLLLFAAGCGSSDDEFTFSTSGEEGGAPAASAETAASGGAGPMYQSTGNEGTLTGTIHFTGTAPTMRPLMMDADAACAAAHTGPVYPENVVTNDNGTLRNVFVHIKSGLNYSFPVPQDHVILDQKGCMYVPHVIGVMAQQPIEVRNDDNTTHNIHPMPPEFNREWNIGQAAGAEPIVKSFARPEASIPVKCNQHPWMRSWIHVMSDPFYAVTGDDGTFTISGLPPGDYEVEVIHEQYGAQTMQVSVPANGSATADFTYDSSMAYDESSLEMLPALVLP